MKFWDSCVFEAWMVKAFLVLIQALLAIHFPWKLVELFASRQFHLTVNTPTLFSGRKSEIWFILCLLSHHIPLILNNGYLETIGRHLWECHTFLGLLWSNAFFTLAFYCLRSRISQLFQCFEALNPGIYMLLLFVIENDYLSWSLSCSKLLV